ncbi:LytTR family DNA-binding domain-containing protein [Rurimicrobium arvi]|uniref:LytTR family DNA-binding domain-containing protein n=1 Tax=Rurimicrobium arvi TaxID=2049916 RepID=A0ABP8MYC2_9BACT
MKPINTIIVDDEADSIELLQIQLKKHCPQVHVLATFNDPLTAMAQMGSFEPDLIFSDIEMPRMTGLELMQRARPAGAQVVFVTAFNEYAVKAFRANALDFLTKPVQESELIEVVNKVQSNLRQQLSERLESAKNSFQNRTIDRIAIATQQDVSFIRLADIVMAEAKNSYAELLLQTGKKVLMSKSLKDLEDITDPDKFIRIHRQYLVNIDYVRSFNRQESTVLLKDNIEIPVARAKRDELFQKFSWL